MTAQVATWMGRVSKKSDSKVCAESSVNQGALSSANNCFASVLAVVLLLLDNLSQISRCCIIKQLDLNTDNKQSLFRIEQGHASKRFTLER